MSKISVEGLSKTFGRGERVTAVDGLDLEVSDGEVVVLLGPSGCGKSTTLRCLAGLEDANAGRITIGDELVFDSAAGVNKPTHRRNIGMVFQNYALWPHLTVRQNVAYPLRARGKRSAISNGRVLEVLEIVQCAHLSDRLPSQLSGGQQQRVALARAIASEPSVLFLDEPLSNLDTLLRDELRAQLLELHRRLGFTGIHVTHDQVEAFTLGDRVAVMRDGRIEQLGAPVEVFLNPVSEYVADFVGARNRVELVREGDGWRSQYGSLDWHVALPTGSEIGEASLRLRPENMSLHSVMEAQAQRVSGADGDELFLGRGEVLEASFGGPASEYLIGLASSRIRVIDPGGVVPRFALGEFVEIGFKAEQALLYVDEGLQDFQLRPNQPRVDVG